jgi:hypothetical protein
LQTTLACSLALSLFALAQARALRQNKSRLGDPCPRSMQNSVFQHHLAASESKNQSGQIAKQLLGGHVWLPEWRFIQKSNVAY